MLVRDLMSRDVIAIGRNVTAQDAAIAMNATGARRLAVTQNGKPIGFVTERDLVLRLIAGGLDPVTTPLEQVMSKSVVTVAEHCELEGAVKQFNDRHIRHLLVVNDVGRFTGILSLAEITDHAHNPGSRVASESYVA